MRLSELWRVLRARKLRFLLIFGTMVLLAVGVTLILPQTYLGVASVVIDTKGTDPVTGGIAPGELLPSNLQTQLDIDPVMIQKFQDATEGQGSIRDWLAARLLGKLTAEPAHQDNVVNITFAAPDPQFAADVANAFADAYMQTDFELNMDPAGRQASWFDQQLRQLKKDLEEAKERLSQYQQKKNIVAEDDRLDVESAKLVELTNQLVLAQAAMSDAQTRQRQMTQAVKKGELEQLPDILGNSLLQSMKADLARAEAHLAQVAKRYDRNHPDYQSAAAEVQTLKSKLAGELEVATGSINQTAQIAVQRVSEVQQQVDQQKQHILQLKQEHDRASVLQRDVEIAQHAYDAASNRAGEVRLQSQLNQSTVAVLNTASPASKPARPIMALNVAVGIFLGLMLATSMCCAAEVRDPRLRDIRGLSEVIGLAVLTEIPRAPSRRKLRRRNRIFEAQPPVLPAPGEA
jgi:polysaccharide biosynthesis transport protein